MNRNTPRAFVTKAGKVISTAVLEQYATKNTDGSERLKVDAFQGNYKKDRLIQPLYNPETLAYALELNTYHARCCRVKAQDACGQGWHLHPLKDNPSEEQRKKADDFFSDLTPPITTSLSRWLFDTEAIGYGALELIKGPEKTKGPVTGMAHVPGHTMRQHSDGNKFCQVRGNKRRWFKAPEYPYDVDKETGEERALGTLPPEKRATEILWITLYTPRSDYYGLPEIIPALGAIHGDIARRDYNIAFFDNYGVPAYAVFITGDFDEGEPVDDKGAPDPNGRTPLERVIEQHLAELAKNPHSVLILSVPTRDGQDNGKTEIKLVPLSVQVKDASFRLYRQDNRDEVLSAHGVPPYRLGIAEIGNLGGNTAKESTDVYKTSVLQPRQELVEAMINRYILWSEQGLALTDWEFKLDEIDNTDEKHDMDMLKDLFEVAAVTPNQIIRFFGERFGLEESKHPAMNAHYVNGTPVDLDGDIPKDELEAALNSLQERLTEVAIKYASGSSSGGGDGDGAGIGRILTAVQGAKERTNLAAPGRKPARK